VETDGLKKANVDIVGVGEAPEVEGVPLAVAHYIHVKGAIRMTLEDTEPRDLRHVAHDSMHPVCATLMVAILGPERLL